MFLIRTWRSKTFLIFNLLKQSSIDTTREFHVSYLAYIRKINPKTRYHGISQLQNINELDNDQVSEDGNLLFDTSVTEPKCEVEDEGDFFGIESDVGAICFTEDRKPNLEKFDHIIKKKPIILTEEKFTTASFGQVRRDSDNHLQYHGQYEDSIVDTSLYSFRKMNKNSNLDRFKASEPDNRSHLNHADAHNFNNSVNAMEKNGRHASINKTRGGKRLNKTNELPIPAASIISKKNTDKCTDVSTISSVNDFESPTSPKQTESDFSFIDNIFFQKADENAATSVSQTEKHTPSHINNLDSVFDHTECFGGPEQNENINESEILNFEEYSEKNLGSTLSAEYKKDINCSTDFSSEIDDQYFGQNNVQEQPITHFESNFIDNMYFSNPLETKNVKSIGHEYDDSEDKFIINDQAPLKHSKINERKGPNNKLNGDKAMFDKIYKYAAEKLNEHHNINPEILSEKKFNVHDKRETRHELDNNKNTEFSAKMEKQSEGNDVENTLTAYDYVKKMRNEKNKKTTVADGRDLTLGTGEKLDSKGFRILKNQVPDFSQLSHDELVDVMRYRVLYANDDLIILNKPYNLVMHDAQTNKEPSLSAILDDLARVLDTKSVNPKLFTVHRLDKETTGCLLLARNELTAQHLKALFAQRKITKTYWIVTSRLPDPLEGIIDIPIAEGSILEKARMVLHPDVPRDLKYKPHSKHGKPAVTHYKTMTSYGNAAFVEVRPETGIKHQIRVHFGFGLSCPILGDHKYSHLTKMAPQKLPSDILQRLHVRQSKVRHIPLHIHARSIVVPKMLNGSNLFIYAPMSEHMNKNLKRLKLKK